MAKLQGGKNDFRKMQYHVIFTQRLVGLLGKSVDFSNICCILLVSIFLRPYIVHFQRYWDLNVAPRVNLHIKTAA